VGNTIPITTIKIQHYLYIESHLAVFYARPKSLPIPPTNI
jgi:hypothetical protein